MNQLKAQIPFFTLILFLVPFIAGAQTEYGSLRIQGMAEKSFQPDLSIVRFGIESFDMEYSGAIENIGKKADELVRILKKSGYKEEDIKTVDLNITVNSIYRKGQRIDSGFVGRQTLKLELPYTGKSLINIINSISKTEANPSLSFSFTLSDSHNASIQKELMQAAVLDAREKADILCSASGSQIVGIDEIIYGNVPNPVPNQMMRMAEMDSGTEAGFGGMNVKDIHKAESVHIVFRIKGIK